MSENPQETNSESVSELLWSEIEPQISEIAKERVAKKYKKLTLDPEILAEYEQKAILSERNFFTRVLDGVTNFCELDSEIPHYLLLDIDETIGRPVAVDSSDERLITELRPTLIPLLTHLKDKFTNLGIGFITSRGEDAILRQLDDENELGPINDFIDRTAIYSTRDREITKTVGHYEERDRINLLRNHPLAKKLSDEEIQEFISEARIGDYEKLMLLQKIHDQKPDAAIMPVDDFKYAGCIKNGVCLYPDACFWD